ncbi:hypothetical protein E3J62_09215 [candidate division TA06 bacterium]|uniref:DUF4136 domain-containing protein n=1 Tax=candidate division TA06 bacterium TaxID=2250710 RepID=A0A523UQT3_UNCT6|nr:MAG: hypothetical protein E3J62_09215 [candidate division TA06 bacterium]
MKWLVCLMVIVLIGCATSSLRVTVKPNTEFGRNSAITIRPMGLDWLDAGPAFADALTAAGFNVISAAVASHKEEYKGRVNPGYDGRKLYLSKERVAGYKSKYLLQYGYSSGEADATSYQSLNKFWGDVVDLTTGEIVVFMRYKSGHIGRSPSSVVDEFIEKMIEALPNP